MSDIEGVFERVDAALNTPTLKLLDRKSARVALPLFSAVFPDNAEPIAVERFHTIVDALLEDLRSSGYEVPVLSGKTLAMQWVRERWLFRDPGDGQETYQLTGDAKQAIDYVLRATRTQINVSVSRIETMRRVIADAAMAANPDRGERMRRLSAEIEGLTEEYERLEAGGELLEASESVLTEQFSNVLRELEGLPSDFRRVDDAVREMHRTIAKRFREEERPVGEVVDDYIDQSNKLLTATAEGSAFAGALQLLRNQEWLMSLKEDLTKILDHPWAETLLADEQRQMRQTVDVIRHGVGEVLERRKGLTSTLREHIDNYDHIRNRELDAALRGIDGEMREWMTSARPRDHVNVELMPAMLNIDWLRLRTWDPESERAPEPIEDVSDEAPDVLSLEEIRKSGGPSLEELSRRIEETMNAGDLESAATLFNTLPADLRRPVEIFGLMHLYMRKDAEIDNQNLETITGVRPDGSVRQFRMPTVTVTQEQDTVEAQPLENGVQPTEGTTKRAGSGDKSPGAGKDTSRTGGKPIGGIPTGTASKPADSDMLGDLGLFDGGRDD